MQLTLSTEDSEKILNAAGIYLPEVEEVECRDTIIKLYGYRNDLQNYSDSEMVQTGYWTFKERYGCDIEWIECVFGERWNTLANLILAGDSPDFYAAWATDFPIYSIKGMFQPVDDYVDYDDPLWSGMKYMADNYFSINGKHYVFVTDVIANCVVKGNDENRLPVPDEPAASVVRRMFEMRSQGISPRHIADMLNEEKILTPSDYLYAKQGKPNPRKTSHLWCTERVRKMLQNPTYLGHLVQMRTTTVSHKNHKLIKRNEEDMVVIKNTHEPLVSQEMWDKCREMDNSVSQGKRDKHGEIMPLSGLMYCADCGEKMRLGWNNTTTGSKKKPRKYLRHNYQCGAYSRYGKFYCTSHHIKMKDINAIVLADIRMMSTLVVEDEEKARQQFLAQKEQINSHQIEMEQKRLRDGKYRLEELRKLIPSIYEDKVLGKIPEDVCVNLLEKYQAEQKELSEDVSKLEAKLSAVKQDKDDVEEFIRRLKKYTDVQELTREMALELIEYVTIDEYSADRPRDIHIYYKLLDKPLLNKLRLDTAKIEKPLD